MPAIDINKLPRDQTGQPVYPNDPGYQAALDRQNQALSRMDERLGKTPVQSDVPLAVPTVQPNPLGAGINTINEVEQNVGNLLAPKKESSAFDWVNENIFNPAGNLLKAGGEKISDVASGLGKGISKAASDVGDWASENRVGLGGFGTAIGAGIAGRDASEALSRYNQAIIANKKQRQEELQFDMATNSNNPYNQQFRDLFAKMLPDVTAQLGDSFNKMTVQNFRDAGLDKLLETAQKQIEISKFDSNSSFSKQARAAAESQYGIVIPENVSGAQVADYVSGYVKNRELSRKDEEVSIKRQKGEREERKLTDELATGQLTRSEKASQIEKLNQEVQQKGEMFPSQLEEQKVKSEIATETKNAQILKSKEEAKKLEFANISLDPKSKLSQNAKKDFIKNNKDFAYLITPEDSAADIKDIRKLVVDLKRTKSTNMTSIERQKIQSDTLKQVQAIRDKNANYRAGINNRLGYARLGETERHNRATEEFQNKKLSDKYADTYISQGDLDNQALTKPTISKKLEQGAGARELIRNSKTIMDKIDDVGFKDVAGLTSLSGELQSLYTNIGLDVKQNKALGAYDQGVRDLLSELAKNPTSASALAKKKMVKGQYKAVIDTINNAYKSKSIQQKWDERVGSPVDYTLKLNRAVKDGDAEAIQEFSELGYEQDDLIRAYKNSMPLKRKGGE